MSAVHAPAQSEPLRAADEVNLLLDSGDSVYVVTVAGTLGPGGFVGARGAVDVDALRGVLAERIACIPRLRRRVEGGPGAYRLVEAVVDLRDHVRLLGPVAGFAGFERLCAQVSVARLPRGRPLWELLLVPVTGLTPQVGWVFRVHHALADGMTAARMLDAIFDPEPDSAGAAPTPAAARTPPRPGGYWKGLAGAMVRRLPGTALLGPLGLGRGISLFDVPLADLVQCSRGLGATVNDAVLAVVGAGGRAAFASLGEAVPAELPVSVPVLLPSADGAVNQVSAVVVRVPLDDAAVADRVRAVGVGSRSAVGRARAAPLPWFARTRSGGRVMQWFVARQRMIGVLSTNMRGPARGRALCGAPVAAAWALPVLGGNVRLAVAAVSYAGTMSFCVLWSDNVSEAGTVFAEGIRTALASLLAAG